MWKLSNNMLPDRITLLFSKCNKDISGHENDFVLPATLNLKEGLYHLMV